MGEILTKKDKEMVKAYLKVQDNVVTREREKLLCQRLFQQQQLRHEIKRGKYHERRNN